jgi:hypothetical protein
MNELPTFVDFYGPANNRRKAFSQEIGLEVGWEEDDRNGLVDGQIGYRNSASLSIPQDYDEQVWPQIYPTPPIMIQDPNRNLHGLGYESDGYQD